MQTERPEFVPQYPFQNIKIRHPFEGSHIGDMDDQGIKMGPALYLK
jgi:hypothetical protein